MEPVLVVLASSPSLASASFTGLGDLPGGAIEVACWAHVRRKFVDAEATDPTLAKEAVRDSGRLGPTATVSVISSVLSCWGPPHLE